MINQVLKDAAYAYIDRDPVLYVDLLDSLRRDASDLLYAAPDGVLLYNRPGEMYSFSCGSAIRAAELLARCEPCEPGTMLMLHELEYKSLLNPAWSITEGPCCNAVYPETVPSAPPLPPGVVIRRLPAACLPVVIENYAHGDDEAYMRECIERGMYGAFFEDTLLGFIGTHAEGSIGLLHILPPYRRQGLASALEIFMCSLLLKQGRIPFGQIFMNNETSISLQRKLGFAISEKPIQWFFRQ